MGNNSSNTCKTDCQLCWQLQNDCDACFNSPTDTGCDPTKAPDNCESCWRWKQPCYDCFEGGCCSQNQKSQNSNVRQEVQKSTSSVSIERGKILAKKSGSSHALALFFAAAHVKVLLIIFIIIFLVYF